MIGRMNEPALHVGDLVRCPHCRRWHPAIRWHTEGTPYTQRMLYIECKGLRYYAGQDGLPSRHEIRNAGTRSVQDRAVRVWSKRDDSGCSGKTDV
jgi:hypothetical protein